MHSRVFTDHASLVKRRRSGATEVFTLTSTMEAIRKNAAQSSGRMHFCLVGEGWSGQRHSGSGAEAAESGIPGRPGMSWQVQGQWVQRLVAAASGWGGHMANSASQ